MVDTTDSPPPKGVPSADAAPAKTMPSPAASGTTVAALATLLSELPANVNFFSSYTQRRPQTGSGRSKYSRRFQAVDRPATAAGRISHHSPVSVSGSADFAAELFESRRQLQQQAEVRS